MKRKTTIQFRRFILSSLVFMLCLATKPSVGCVDYHPAPFTTVNYGDLFLHAEIIVHNMHLFGGANGDFCTCAFSSYTDLFSDVYYVAFVDSGTTDPLPGFNVWQADAGSTNGWSSIMAGTEWAGFISAVTASGLPAGQAVDLIIRTNLPSSWYFVAVLDSALLFSQLGTDAADPITHLPSNMHQSVSGYGPITYNEVPEGYFTGINIPVEMQVGIFPNPAYTDLMIRSNGTIIRQITLMNIHGAIVSVDSDLKDTVLHLNISDIVHGIYFLSIKTDAGNISRMIEIL